MKNYFKTKKQALKWLEDMAKENVYFTVGSEEQLKAGRKRVDEAMKIIKGEK